MSDIFVVGAFLINLVGVIIIGVQTRITLERRISVLETYMKIFLRDKGISIRADDSLCFKDRKEE